VISGHFPCGDGHGLATLVAQDAIPPERYEQSKLQIMNGVERALTGKVSKTSSF
jgi:hypothetical protein